MVKRIGAKSVFTCIGLEEAMAKYKSYNYDQRMMIPVSLEEPLVPDLSALFGQSGRLFGL